MKFLQSSSEDVLVAVLKSLTAVSFQEAEKLGGQLVVKFFQLTIVMGGLAARPFINLNEHLQRKQI